MACQPNALFQFFQVALSSTWGLLDLETAKAALRLYEALDDYDDALNVFSNFDVAEEILEQLG